MGGDEGISYLHVFDVFEGVMLLLVWMATLRMEVKGGRRRKRKWKLRSTQVQGSST